jgi:hypothetical protein
MLTGPPEEEVTVSFAKTLSPTPKIRTDPSGEVAVAWPEVSATVPITLPPIGSVRNPALTPAPGAPCSVT